MSETEVLTEILGEMRALREAVERGQGDVAPTLLDREQAAAYLRLSVSQLDNLARCGDIRRVKFGEGPRARVLYRRKDLETYVAAHVSIL